MSNHPASITVVIAPDYRNEESVKAIIAAVKMIKGVLDAEIGVTDSSIYLAYVTARYELEQKLWDALKKSKGEF
jgi:hypothetical protein